jgi:hypothetical protein
MKTSEQIDKVCQALFKVQSKIEPVKADSVNPHFKSTYADLESVWGAVHGLLKEAGLIVIQGAMTEPNAVFTRIIEPTSGQWLESQTPMILDKQTPQAVGSAFTYYRRYSLAAMLGLVQTDDDAETATNRKPKPQYDEARFLAAKAKILDAKTADEAKALTEPIRKAQKDGVFSQDMVIVLFELIESKLKGGK